MVRRGIVPDVLTDQTSAHDALNGYVPHGMTLDGSARACAREIRINTSSARCEHGRACARRCWRLQKKGAITFDYGNNIRAQAEKAGVENAFDIPGFVPEYIRPLFCEGRGPFRWVALSGDPADIARTDRLALEMFPENETLARWMKLAQERIQFQGLPARICWLGYGERAEFGLAMNDLVRKGEIKAPIVIGRDHLDAGSVASPNRETEGMLDGSDAIADWPLLERAGQYRGGRLVGFDSQRRRSRDWLFAARRHGGGGGRDRKCQTTIGTRADQRSRDGRASPRGCRLFPRDRVSPGPTT